MAGSVPADGPTARQPPAGVFGSVSLPLPLSMPLAPTLPKQIEQLSLPGWQGLGLGAGWGRAPGGGAFKV